MPALPAINRLRTDLSAPLDVLDTVAWVVTTEGWPAAGIFSVDQEIVAYTGLTENTFTGLTRAFDNTLPAYHRAQARVDLRITAKHLNDAAFINPLPTPLPVGGIQAGSTFPVRLSVQEMLESLLYPYQIPSIVDFWLVETGSPYQQVGVGDPAGRVFVVELGEVLPSNIEFNFTMLNPENVQITSPGEYELFQDFPEFNTLLAQSSGSPISYSSSPGIGPFDIPTTVPFRITFTDTNGITRDQTAFMVWTTRCYTGSVPLADPDLVSPDVLNSFLTTADNQLANVWAWKEPGWKWLMVGEIDGSPSGSPSPSQSAAGWINDIREVENNFEIPMADFTDHPAFFNQDDQGFFYATKTYTNTFGVTFTLRVYRTKHFYHAPLETKIT